MKDHISADTYTRTFATLRINGKSLDPSSVTARLRLNPSEAKYAGEPRGKSGHWLHSYWELSSKEHVSSADLEAHLIWLIDAIEPSAPELQQLQIEDLIIDIFCFWETSLVQGGITLSPEILRRIGELDLALGVDIYFAS